MAIAPAATRANVSRAEARPDPSGREYFDFVTSKKPENFSQEELVTIIKKSIKIKSKIVKMDPREKDLRKVLNFGHTIGHALESLSWKTAKPLLHGEAIAIGMIAESNLASYNLVGCTAKDLILIKKAIVNAGLPVNIKNINSTDIKKMILSDKKNFHDKINFSLPKRIGEILVNISAEENLIIKAIESILI